MTNLSIVIVNWNSADLLKKCLQSIKKNLTIPSDVWVIDNASVDKSAELVKKNFPWVKLIANKENLGFGKANNQALRKIKTEYVLILNPDTEILKGSIETLVGFLENSPKVGVCAPLLLNPDKTIQKMGYYRISPSLKQAWYFYTENYNSSMRSKSLINKYWEKQINLRKENEVDQIPGACFLARMEILKKVNFFDEKFPLLFEDVDLCFRIKALDYKVIINPKSKIIHVGGVSFKKMDEVDFHARFFKGLFIFFDKHKNIFERILIRLIVLGSLTILINRKLLGQIIRPNNIKKEFVKNKWRLLKLLA